MRRASLFGSAKGTGKVFSFTFAQIMKAKANIIGMLVFFLIALASVPVSSITGGGEPSLTADSYEEAGGYYSQEQIDYLRGEGVSEEVLAVLSQELLANYQFTVSDYLDQEEEDFSMDTFSFQLGYIVIVFMFCMLSIASIVRIVIEEKASKLVDLLMVSVEPLALLYGKVLAELLYMICSMLIALAGAVLSYLLFADLFPGGVIGSLLAGGFSMNGGGPGTGLVMLITALLGMLLFGLLSGLCGAGCSTIEESNSAMGLSMILILAGYFIAVVAMAIDQSSLNHILSLIPPISVFLMPTQVMAGRLGMGYVFLSWALLIICIGLVLKLAAGVYRGLIIYNGSTKKFSQILKMAGKGEA